MTENGFRTPTADELQQALTQPRVTIATRAGVVQYTERGGGPALLVVHGSPGGCDQGLLLGEVFRVNGFRVIAPSRPGYLDTPLRTGRTVIEQADALAALLEALGVDRAGVVGFSGGGPSSYLLAARHPDRVRCLLEMDSLCMPYRQAHPRMERMTWSRPAIWLLLQALKLYPDPLLTAFFGADAADRSATERRARQVAMMRTVTETSSGPLRRHGYDNDLVQFRTMDARPLGTITVPTLIVHGTDDTEVPPDHARQAAELISGARLQWIPGGGHAAFLINEPAQRKALDWLSSQHAAR